MEFQWRWTHFSMAGRTALVTGASSGLGRHFAVLLARAGANVAVAARRGGLLAEVHGEIEATGRKAAVVIMDMTDATTIARAFEEAEATLGPIDVLVNNAGTTARGAAEEISEADWDRVVDTNLKGDIPRGPGIRPAPASLPRGPARSPTPPRCLGSGRGRPRARSPSRRLGSRT